jgi:hypothetical protein
MYSNPSPNAGVTFLKNSRVGKITDGKTKPLQKMGVGASTAYINTH